MMLTLSREAQRSIDERAASELGLPPMLLMEQAGLRIVEVIQDKITAGQIRAVLCYAGTGNNGGDAWAAARMLHALNIDTAVVTNTPAREEEGMPQNAARLARFQAERLQIPVLAPEDAEAWLQGLGLHADMSRLCAVDGILGSGFDRSRDVSSDTEVLLKAVNSLRDKGAAVLSVDIPSGVSADSGLASRGAVRADVTVTFLAPKQGCVTWPGRGHCGELLVRGLGLPEGWWKQAAHQYMTSAGATEVRWNVRESLALRVPKRGEDSHKGTNGDVLILAGCPDTPGAALLAAESALRSGVGLTYLMVDKVIAAGLLVRTPEAVIRTIADADDWTEADRDLERIREAMEKVEAVVLGPGSGNTVRTVALLELALRHARRLLLDADALNAAVAHRELFRDGIEQRKKDGLHPPVLSPHPGEFKRLFPDIDVDDRLAAAREAALQSGCHIILKGAGTVLAAPDGRTVRVNSSGNSALARGGSGDLLSGLCGSFMAQMEDIETALDLAVFLHGYAADLAVQDSSAATETGFSFQDWFAGLPEGFAHMGFR